MKFAIVGSGAVGAISAPSSRERGRMSRSSREAPISRPSAPTGFASKAPSWAISWSTRLPRAILRRSVPVDVVLFTVKAYDNDQALRLLPPLIGPETVVLTLQNGVDSVDEVANAVGESHVLGGTTYVATALESPGVIVQTGVHRSIIFGEVFGTRGRITPRVQAIADVMTPADIIVTPVADGRVPIWDKFVYLAPFSGFTGAARLPIGGIWGDPQVRDDVLRRRSRDCRAG